MIHNYLQHRELTCFLVIWLTVCGCSSKKETSTASNSPTAGASTSPSDGKDSVVPAIAEQSMVSTADQLGGTAKTDIGSNNDVLADELFGESGVSNDRNKITSSEGDSSEKVPSLSSAAASSNRLRLRSDLTANQLTEFLKLADLELQNVVSGRAGVHDQREAVAELVRVGKMKLQASENLENVEGATEEQKSLGKRGQLQALSQLAAQGDLPSAERLEKLANEWVQSQDAAVVEDSRLVLIGLELEKIQNGSSKDATKVLQLLDDLVSVEQTHDIAALMVMGQAKHILDEYGFKDAASTVRGQVAKLFGAHPDPNIASIASQIAGSSSYAALEQQLTRLAEGQQVTAEEWNAAIQTALSAGHDMVTVHFLASAAAQAEALDHLSLADKTFELMGEDPKFEEAERAEIETIYRAYLSRRSLIGKPLELDLQSVDGQPLALSDYRGKTVLIPFWTIAIPDSLSQLQLLKQLREESPDKVEIVGINLDRDLAEPKEFENQSPVDFRSFAAIDQFDDNGKNAIARKFGVVSVPYVLVIAPDGTIVGYDFTGQRLKDLVQAALNKNESAPNP